MNRITHTPLPRAALLAALATLALQLPATGLAQQGSPAKPAAKPTAKPATKPGAFREIKWDELVPKDWDPSKEIKALNQEAGSLSDADPRASQYLKKMRQIWDNAPANPALDGQAVRLPGYVVPLEESKDGLKEFLLVPYFGACIHSPPPPANQIVYVLPKDALKNVRSMDAVWVNGTITREKVDSYMGAAGYRLQAQSIEPYVEK